MIERSRIFSVFSSHEEVAMRRLLLVGCMAWAIGFGATVMRVMGDDAKPATEEQAKKDREKDRVKDKEKEKDKEKIVASVCILRLFNLNGIQYDQIWHAFDYVTGPLRFFILPSPSVSLLSVSPFHCRLLPEYRTGHSHTCGPRVEYIHHTLCGR